MEDRKQRNLLPRIHRFVTNELGENYWFNGCSRYVMGALGEPEYDYVFFAGLTGDVFTQIFSFDHFRGDCATDYLLSAGGQGYIEDIFAQCGYDASFVPEKRVKAEKETYLRKILDYIDRGVPVISNLVISGHDAWLVFVGYERSGEILLFMTDNMTAPEQIPAEAVFAEGQCPQGEERSRGLVFVGEKRGQKDLAQLYRQALEKLPALPNARTSEYCFGAAAFRAWADEIESGRYDHMRPEDFEKNKWFIYANYICVLATNGSCCHDFLDRAEKLNPDMTWLSELHQLYRKMADMWERDPDGLEAMGAGFNITLEALKNRERRANITAKIREYAGIADQVLAVLERETGLGKRAAPENAS